MPSKNKHNKNGTNRGPAKKSPQKSHEKGDNTNHNGGINRASVVAGLTGFALLGSLFVFFWWGQDQLEKFHIGGVAIIFCFLAFLVGIGCIAWLLIEIFGQGKWIISFTAILCIGFGAFLWRQRMEFYSPQEPPSVSLDIGPNIDPKDPFGQSFTIFNQGKQTISNVWASAYWTDPNVGKKFVFSFAALNPVPRIIPTGKQALHFSHIPGATNLAPLPPFNQKTWVNIEVRFTPADFAYETNHVFQFCVFRDDAGNHLWMYDGEGESLHDIKSRIDQQQIQPIDLVPFVDVNVISVTNDASTVPEHPLQIAYSWKNVGGHPATKIEIQWAVVDPKTGIINVWSNLWPNAIFDQVLWPGMTNGEVRFYREPTAPALFDGVISNSLILLGSADYQDLVGGDFFTEQFKAVRTNDSFETRYLGIHSKYGDWRSK